MNPARATTLDAARKMQFMVFLEQDLRALKQTRTGLNHSMFMAGIYGYAPMGQDLKDELADALRLLDSCIDLLSGVRGQANYQAEEDHSRCETCKHWGEPLPSTLGFPIAECGQELVFTLFAGDYPPGTPADYCCNRWEEKCNTSEP